MGQKHYFLLVTAPQITLETLLPLLFRQFLEEVFSETELPVYGVLGNSHSPVQ
jgi:hypothetical protein